MKIKRRIIYPVESRLCKDCEIYFPPELSICLGCGKSTIPIYNKKSSIVNEEISFSIR